jgi:hypothetical protein
MTILVYMSFLVAVLSGYLKWSVASNRIPKLNSCSSSWPSNRMLQTLFSSMLGLFVTKLEFGLVTNLSLQLKIITVLHDSALGGHSIFLVTYQRIHQLFAWPNMKTTMKEYVVGCSVCQQLNLDRSKYHWLIQPLPVLEQELQVVSLDFIEILPKFAHADSN